MLVPVNSWPDQTGCVLHLPGTGDQGFGRRMSLGLSLLKHVSLLLHFLYQRVCVSVEYRVNDVGVALLWISQTI